MKLMMHRIDENNVKVIILTIFFELKLFSDQIIISVNIHYN